MKLTHKEYLERILSDRKMELKELEIENRIRIAENNAKSEMLQKEIFSIETQLQEGIE
jgi:hypothetical protein